MRAPFLSDPQAWLRTPRTGQSAAERATPITRHRPRMNRRDRWLRAVGFAVMCGAAAMLLA